MADESLNPYSPPTTETAPAEPAARWRVEGDLLMVRNGARLPAVDLSGRGGELTPFASVYRAAQVKGPGFLLMLGAIISAMVMRERIVERIGQELWIALFIAICVVSARFSRGSLSEGVARVAGFAAVASLRARMRRGVWRRRVMWLGMLMILSIWLAPRVLDFGGAGRAFLALPVGGLLLLIASALWRVLDSGPRCVASRDGWLYLKGLPPVALSALSARWSDRPPVLVARKVYTLHQYRLPLGVLVGKRWWNLWVVLLLAIWKARRSPRLERLMFHPAEIGHLPAAEAGTALLERWERATRGTALASWQPVKTSRSDSPLGDMRVITLSFLSPDGARLASTSVTRLATGPFFIEVFEDAVRSWRQDGTLLLTTSSKSIGPQPSWIESVRRKSGPAVLVEVHDRRIQGAGLATPNLEEIAQWSRRESLERHEVLVAAGICSETREEEFTAPDETENSPDRFS